MMKSYEEVKRERPGRAASMEEGLWNIARELSRKNDLLEIDMLCKAADALRASAKSSPGDFHDSGYAMAEELACMAHKKITDICGNAKDVLGEEGA